MAVMEREQPSTSKTLDSFIVSAGSGLVLGGIFGFASAVTNSGVLADETDILITSVVIGIGENYRSKNNWSRYLLSIGSANIYYRLGHDAAKMCYDFLK